MWVHDTFEGGRKRVLIVFPEGKEQLPRPKNRCDDSIKHFNE